MSSSSSSSSDGEFQEPRLFPEVLRAQQAKEWIRKHILSGLKYEQLECSLSSYTSNFQWSREGRIQRRAVLNVTQLEASFTTLLKHAQYPLKMLNTDWYDSANHPHLGVFSAFFTDFLPVLLDCNDSNSVFVQLLALCRIESGVALVFCSHESLFVRVMNQLAQLKGKFTNQHLLLLKKVKDLQLDEGYSETETYQAVAKEAKQLADEVCYYLLEALFPLYKTSRDAKKMTLVEPLASLVDSLFFLCWVYFQSDFETTPPACFSPF